MMREELGRLYEWARPMRFGGAVRRLRRGTTGFMRAGASGSNLGWGWEEVDFVMLNGWRLGFPDTNRIFSEANLRFKLGKLLILTVGFSSLMTGSLLRAANFYDLGILPGGTFSSGFGVSDTGLAGAGGANSWSLSLGPFLWTPAAGMVGLDLLPGDTQGGIYGMSADGSTMVGFNYSPAGHNQAARWTTTSGAFGLGFLTPPGSSLAKGVSGDGSVIAGYASDAAGNDQAYRWTQSGGMVALGKLPGATESHAYGISRDGRMIVGDSGVSSSWQAIRWTRAVRKDTGPGRIGKRKDT